MTIRACILVLALASVGAASAQPLYKVVGADGKITYTDQRPSDPKTATEIKIITAPSTPLPESVLKYQAELQKSMRNRIADAQRDPSTTPSFFTAVWCGYCKTAKAYLQARKISFSEYDIDTEAGAKAYFEAGGKRGVPLLVGGGKRVEGFSQGPYDAFFAGKK